MNIAHWQSPWLACVQLPALKKKMLSQKQASKGRGQIKDYRKFQLLKTVTCPGYTEYWPQHGRHTPLILFLAKANGRHIEEVDGLSYIKCILHCHSLKSIDICKLYITPH